MSKKIIEIKKLIKKECQGANFNWFYDTHLLNVEKFSKELLKKLPEANKEIVMLCVWLHDLQRIRKIEGDHQEIGAEEAEKVMKQFQYSEAEVIRVKEAILSHSCGKRLPKSLEGKILASADAMSHYVDDFYLKIAVTGQRNLADYKKWALEKLDRDYNKKIFFGFAKKIIDKRHKILLDFFMMG